MAKTQEELKVIKEEVETLNNKLKELTDEELEQVSGGIRVRRADSDAVHPDIHFKFYNDPPAL